MEQNANQNLADRILAGLTTAVVMLDERLCLSRINPSGEMLFGHSAKHCLGRPFASLLAEGEPWLVRIREAMEQDQPYTEREQPLILADGRAITVDYTLTPILESRKRREVVLEMLQIDRHLRIAREESLLGQQETVRHLIRGLAHEIKNPLGGLRGAAQLLERELYDPELKEYTQIIIEEADRLRNLVNRMLGPRELPRMRRLNVHQLLERVRSLLLAEEPEPVSIQRDYDPSIPEIDADGEMLIQALLNIARNAVEALRREPPPGALPTLLMRTRVQRNVTLGNERHRLVAAIELIDNGPGIPEAHREAIFFPMFTTRAEGTGLGLSIAQSLLGLHRGLIECESQPGETRFTLLLPLEQKDA